MPTGYMQASPMYWRLKLRESHLLFTALAHVSISSYTSVAAALCLKLLCMSARDDVPYKKGARTAAPASP